MTPTPSFSIIIPTFQRREMVCAAIRAVSRLNYSGPTEFIVVVDGSTDGTAAALSRLDCSLPIRVIEQDNQGLAAARNRGAAEATGELLLFLDDDMICEPDLLLQHQHFHLAGADAVTGEVRVHAESKPGLVTDRLALAAAWPRGDNPSAFDLYGGHLSVRRDVFRDLGGFDEALHAGGYGGEDLDFGLRLVDGYQLRHNPSAVARQVSLIGPTEHMKRARALAASDRRLLAKHPQIATELLSHRGLENCGKTPLAIRLSAVPILPAVTAKLAASLAELARPTPFRSSGWLARFYFTARSISYWSAFRNGGGNAILREHCPG